MLKQLVYLSMALLILFQPVFSASINDYIEACTSNQKNNMGPELCECMANKGKDLSEEEFDFFYAIAAKDQDKVNKGHVTLDANQKMNVMQLSMMGPSKCTNELAQKKNNSETQDSPSNSSSSATSTTEADSTLSQ